MVNLTNDKLIGVDRYIIKKYFDSKGHNEFDYEKFKANNFEVERLGDYPLELLDKED